MIHVVLAGQLFLVKTATVLAILFTNPSAVRYCVCVNVFNQIYAPVVNFSIVFVNVLLACLSVVQFLIIKGKIKLVGWKFVAVLVAVSIFYSLLWGIATYLYNGFRQVQFECAQLCQDAPVSSTALTLGISIVMCWSLYLALAPSS